MVNTTTIRVTTRADVSVDFFRQIDDRGNHRSEAQDFQHKKKLVRQGETFFNAKFLILKQEIITLRTTSECTAAVRVSISDVGDQSFGDYSTNDKNLCASEEIIMIIIISCRVTIKSLKKMSSDPETENDRHLNKILNLQFIYVSLYLGFGDAFKSKSNNNRNNNNNSNNNNNNNNNNNSNNKNNNNKNNCSCKIINNRLKLIISKREKQTIVNNKKKNLHDTILNL
ncbi:hypothetical protein AGLY_010039 [Aphis glycines]|uniref:Uncharacterized protein n=1 Tax=Aphis glycines TaxID=307491 RepID=A0A6G0TH47_APHGL|nr:hypothetical protein AGLY_010039 [Aphis glycines]